MLVEQAEAAISAAYGLARLQELSAALWKDHGDGKLSDDEAQSLAEKIHARMTLAKAAGSSSAAPVRARSIFPPRRRQASPDRAKSRQRRRHLASASGMPPALAAHFTEAERSALKIVADEVRKWGQCDLFIDEIAARAGISRTSTQNALRQAMKLGFIMVEIRKRRGQKNDSNIVRITCAEWREWLNKAPKQDRVQMPEHHGKQIHSRKEVTAKLTAHDPAMRHRNVSSRPMT